ncbi:hypothetical protein EV421DRAFT_1737799 [Armillaria borealis]|uniref:Uncharacterized protein n=1 Tax=Armillaria borealis TaxID=47425 RepID=A0AA39MMR1_9AGAR|nr:hypothetical protein EV421DRAFT_1737799 [Armillaria borealis]
MSLICACLFSLLIEQGTCGHLHTHFFKAEAALDACNHGLLTDKDTPTSIASVGSPENGTGPGQLMRKGLYSLLRLGSMKDLGEWIVRPSNVAIYGATRHYIDTCLTWHGAESFPSSPDALPFDSPLLENVSERPVRLESQICETPWVHIVIARVPAPRKCRLSPFGSVSRIQLACDPDLSDVMISKEARWRVQFGREQVT